MAAVEISDDPIVETVDPTVNGKRLSSIPGGFNDGRSRKAVDLRTDAELAQPVVPRFFAIELF